MAEDAPATAAATVAPEADERRYLLALFWDAALGFWRKGVGPDRLGADVRASWRSPSSSLGLQYRLNVWYRAMFDALDQQGRGRRSCARR